MNILIRWYNQNKRMIWVVSLTIIGVFALIQALNNYYKNNTKEKSSSASSTTTYNAPNYSIITEKEIDNDVSENSQAIIKNFFDYCNNSKITEAYNLLSDDCKKELYPSINEFKQKYFDIVFTNTKTYSSNLWISKDNKNTYRLEIHGDILGSGKKDEMPIEEYYTVIYENGKYSLNIRGYIGKENINISKSQSGINISILSKQIYMEYEKYFIEVKNSSRTSVVLNTKQDTNSLYLEDENDVKHIAFLNEISDYDLNIQNGFTKKYNIRFNRTYKPNINIKKVVFDNVKIGQDSKMQKIEVEI